VVAADQRSYGICRIEKAARTADLCTRVDSRLAVLVRLERSRLATLLESRSVFWPDFATVAEPCNAGAKRLDSKVKVLEEMDLVLGRLAKKLMSRVPPTQVDDVYTTLQEANVLLSKSELTDEEIDAAGKAVTLAAGKVDALNQQNEMFGTELADRIHTLLADIDATLAASITYTAILNAIPEPNSLLRAVAPNVQRIGPEKYVELDTAIEKMTLVRRYVLNVRRNRRC